MGFHGRQTRPGRVLQAAHAILANPILKSPTAPIWIKAVEKVPPAELHTRPYLPQHQPLNPRARKPRNLYRPTKLVYPEDELRQTFYRDHPWELARPMMLLETNGLDARSRDWSKGVRQPNMKLSGECVVQRQLWLMENQGMSKDEAYDNARREFYKLRNQEEIEARVAVEEARMVGGYFGKTLLQVGMQLEDKEFESWKGWAGKEIAKQQSLGDEAAADVSENTPALEELVDGVAAP